MEQQLASAHRERKVAELVEDHEVQARYRVGHPPLPLGPGFRVEAVREVGGRTSTETPAAS